MFHNVAYLKKLLITKFIQKPLYKIINFKKKKNKFFQLFQLN